MRHDASAVEQWMLDRRITVVHVWRYGGATTRSVVGAEFACARAPAVHALLGEVVVDTLPPDELRMFAEAMRYGDDDHRRKLVNAANERALKLLQ